MSGVRGLVTIDLTREPPTGSTQDRHRLSVLDRCPSGVTVVVDIGHRAELSSDVVDALHRHGHRLDVVVSGADPAVVERFVKAARSGDWSVAS